MYSPSEMESAQLCDVLDAQYGALARWQARALGLSDDAFDRRLASGAFEPAHSGVAVARAWRHHPLAPSAAAVLRGGRGAHLALWSAAGLLSLDLRGASPDLHLWVPHVDRRPSPARGLRMRRSSLLSSSLDVTVRQRLPTTTRERAVVDRLALPMSSRDREGLLAEVLQRGLTTEPRLAACAARNLRGAKAVRSLLGLLAGHDSGLELELDGIARSTGVVCAPLMTVVLPDGPRHEVDLLAVAAGLVLEADGWAFHSSPAEREADELRDEALRDIGLEVLRFTARQIREDPDGSHRRILRAYEGRSWAPPPGVLLERRHVRAA